MPKRKRHKDDDGETHKTWDWTVYWKDDEELQGWLTALEAWKPDCTRLQVAQEVCPTTGRLHLQCKCTFRYAKRWAAFQKLMGKAHFEVSACECFVYTAKPDSKILICHDGRKRQGERSDLQRCIDSAAAGGTQRELFTHFGPTMVRYGQGIERAQKVLKEHEALANYALADFGAWEPFTDWTLTYILCGNAGIGKTEFAVAHFNNPLLCTEIDQLLDYDPDEHDGIVFDDMDFKEISRSTQIALVDQTMPRAIRCRYRSPVIPRGTKKIFTCNSWPMDIDDPAIRRRVSLVIGTDRETALAIPIPR